jgi:hypothetical protein
MMLSTRAVILLSILNLTACAADMALPPHGHTAWDPRPPYKMTDQIPNWRNESAAHCCGQHTDSCTAEQSPRC